MTARKLIAIALVTIVAAAGIAVAAPPDHAGAGNAPIDVPNDEHANDNADDGSDNADDGLNNADENASDADANERAYEGAGNADGVAPAQAGAGSDQAERGPPADLPEQVPDHVSEIHDLIRGFMDGSVENLGEQISAVVGGSDDPEAEG